MKSKGLVNNIGISLYKSNEVNKILKFWKPDVIQLPYNIFNRDIEVKKILPILKRKKNQSSSKVSFSTRIINK